jgi:hypothetical protein
MYLAPDGRILTLSFLLRSYHPRDSVRKSYVAAEGVR